VHNVFVPSSDADRVQVAMQDYLSRGAAMKAIGAPA